MVNNQGIDVMVLAGTVTAIPPDNGSIDVANRNGARSIAAAENVTINAVIPPDDNDNNQDKTIRLLTVAVYDRRSGVQD